MIPSEYWLVGCLPSKKSFLYFRRAGNRLSSHTENICLEVCTFICSPSSNVRFHPQDDMLASSSVGIWKPDGYQAQPSASFMLKAEWLSIRCTF